MPKINKNHKPSLCWDCYRCDHWINEPVVCSWARDFKPVEGWKAEPTEFWMGKRKIPSFHVIECPLFLKGR